MTFPMQAAARDTTVDVFPHAMPNSSAFPVVFEPDQSRTVDYDWGLVKNTLFRAYVSREQIGLTHVEPTSNIAFRPEDWSKSVEFSPGIVQLMEIVGGRSAELREAMSDLDEAVAEARQEEFPIPSNSALANARRLLLAMYAISPQRFEVYPTPDGEVAIDAPGGRGRSVLLLCESNGGALCLVNLDGRHRRARYSDTGSLPDGFVREALNELVA